MQGDTQTYNRLEQTLLRHEYPKSHKTQTH